VNAPLFRTLTRAEFESLPLDERMTYMRELLQDIHIKLEETREQIERSKRLVPESGG